MKEIKFNNIFLRSVSLVVVTSVGVGSRWTSIHFALHKTETLLFLISKFSYPSDFLTIKTRLSRRLSLEKTKVVFFVPFKILFSSRVQIFFLVKLSEKKKKQIKKKKKEKKGK